MIYCLKIYIFRDQFDITDDELDKIREINKFLVKIYVQAWFTCPSPTSAPGNDLLLLKRILMYKIDNKKVSTAAFHSFRNHLWYLNESLVGLAFFDSRIDVQEKICMAEALSRKSSANFPKRICLEEHDVMQKRISDFVTENTLKYLIDYGIGIKWLEDHPDKWETNREYREAKRLFQQLHVVNDCAERAIKLTTEFTNSLTKSEKDFQNLLQTVENQKYIFNKNLTKSLAFKSKTKSQPNIKQKPTSYFPFDDINGNEIFISKKHSFKI